MSRHRRRRHRRSFFLDDQTERPAQRRTESDTARIQQLLNSLPTGQRVETEVGR